MDLGPKAPIPSSTGHVTGLWSNCSPLRQRLALQQQRCRWSWGQRGRFHHQQRRASLLVCGWHIAFPPLRSVSCRLLCWGHETCGPLQKACARSATFSCTVACCWRDGVFALSSICSESWLTGGSVLSAPALPLSVLYTTLVSLTWTQFESHFTDIHGGRKTVHKLQIKSDVATVVCVLAAVRGLTPTPPHSCWVRTT